MGLRQLEVIFSGDSTDDEGALNIILSVLESEGHKESNFVTYGQVISWADLERKVYKSKRFPTDLHFSGLDFRYGKSFGRSHGFLVISNEISPSENWDAWVSVAAKSKDFVLAWDVDREYSFWQNAQDPLEYKWGGRGYTNLPVVGNGLPPPLDGIVIDTSRNPGRRVLHDRYVEGIGSKMWLSRLFWECAGRERNDKELAAKGWQVTPLPGGMLEIEVPTDVFTEQGNPEFQARLRFAIYGT